MSNFIHVIEFIRSLYPAHSFISLHEPYFGGNEKMYVLDCIDSTFVSSVGKYVDRFEEMVRDFTGAKFAVATVNGTAALHISLLLAGVKRNDLVITQPLTFIATCNAISYCGAEPVFVDIDPKTLGLSADSLEQWLKENADIGVVHSEHPQSRTIQYCMHKASGLRISACVPMHTFGHPCEIDRIVKICNQYQIPVVEDAAESIGSYFKTQHTGTFGLMGTFSFNGNKTITSGGGGMIITNDAVLAKLAKHLTTQAKKPHLWNLEHDSIGYNYRMPNINAALGCAQMELLPEILMNKRETAGEYKAFFKQINEIEFIIEPVHSISNYWLNVILMENQIKKDEFLKLTIESKVTTRPAWALMNKLKMFEKSVCGDLSTAKEIETKLVNIPSSYRNNCKK